MSITLAAAPAPWLARVQGVEPVRLPVAEIFPRAPSGEFDACEYSLSSFLVGL